ncbi:unnamed protein product [Mytilus coruscus]|uniref:B box-type domain-containing protein n=1 Tax=Mytilus coruscus TaxID=42192 RepID=A0A6J8BTJ3_MYTCO|nr:unnamed protein product [Mytilus coruscus]
MASSSGVVCEICAAQHITKSANYWCPECEEGLCSECQKHHSFSKGTRTHDIISIENYLKLSTAISKITSYCNEHNSKYQNYCPHRDKMCCPVCISDHHKNCCGLKSLQEIVKISKASALLESTEQSLEDIMYNFDIIMKDRKQNLTAIQNQRKLFHAEIKQIREKVNSHLDSLEEQILLKLNKAEKEIKSFFGSKLLETEAETEKKYLELLFEDRSLHKNELKCSISEKISDILTTITAFGSVSIETSQSSIVLKTDKEKHAQTLSPVAHPPKSIDNIRFSFKSKLLFPNKQQLCFHGFMASPSGLMVLSDTPGCRLCIMNPNGTFDLIKKGLNCYNDITFVDDSTVAASTENAIEIINIHSKVTARKIDMRNCYGIRYYNGKLLCNVLLRGIHEIHLSNGKVKNLVIQKDLGHWSYLAIHNEKIYQTSNYFIRCYTMKGEKLWEHILDPKLGRARGITVDDNGIVFVAQYYSNSIALFSPDGQRCRQLQINDTKELWGLHFNAIKNLMTVGCVNGTIGLYDILYTN